MISNRSIYFDSESSPCYTGKSSFAQACIVLASLDHLTKDLLLKPEQIISCEIISLRFPVPDEISDIINLILQPLASRIFSLIRYVT